MNEQRRQILQMLAEGKVTADEAERLIDAVERDQPESAPGAALRPKARPKYLRVVMNAEDSPGGDASRLNIRVPLQLLRAVETDSEPEIGGRDNLYTMAAVDACYKSIAERRTVLFSELTGHLHFQ